MSIPPKLQDTEINYSDSDILNNFLPGSLFDDFLNFSYYNTIYKYIYNLVKNENYSVTYTDIKTCFIFFVDLF